MLPTVDFCFKELMQNENVRKGIIAAILNRRPDEIVNTELLPTILRKDSEDDKYGILDVRVQLDNEVQIDFEMQVVYYDYWVFFHKNSPFRFCKTNTYMKERILYPNLL